MARPVKCPHCEETFDRDEVEFKTKNNRYYHLECYNATQKKTDDYQNLIEYICYLRDWKSPTGFVLKQIKEFKEEKGFTDRGIQLALYYMYNIRGDKIPTEMTIGIGAVEYVYDEAMNYYKEFAEINKHNKGVKLEQETRKVHLSKHEKTNKYKKRKMIDLEEIL